ncbi:MAG: type VI secretion protein IcmF/TssM N-terminal domain-containing protein [Thermoguttaceae bacterium]
MKNLLFQLLMLPINVLRGVLSAPGKLLSSGRRVGGLSLPARAALLLAVSLVLCAIISFVAFKYREGTPFLESLTKKPYHVLSVVVLIVAIPVVVYYAIKLWLQGDVSPFEDIDKAWQAGMAELERHGLDISQIPIFLVFGSSGETQEKALFAASRLALNLREVPQGPAAFHWYANPEGIYIVCTRVGSLSRLAAIGHAAAKEDELRPGGPAPPPSAQGIRGTIVAGSPDSLTQSGPLGPLAAGPPLPPRVDIRGTMVVAGRSAEEPDYGGAQAGIGAAPMKPVTLPPDEAAEQDRRLQYLCSLLRRVRQPICPLNGILTLLSFGLILRGPREGIEIQRALKRDLSTVLRVCKVRCPATAAVVGLEQEPGFRELVRRVGRDRAVAQRFGKGFSVTNPPLPERLEALCAHACGAFEDWVYALFREKDALSKPGNIRLYGLLCTVRRHIQTRLGNILVGAFGSDPEQEPDSEPLLFSGCYFAAVGETEDRQAFVKGIFDKLLDEQAELQWTNSAKLEDQKYQRLAQLVSGLDLLLLAGLLVMIGYFFFRK